MPLSFKENFAHFEQKFFEETSSKSEEFSSNYGSNLKFSLPPPKSQTLLLPWE